MDQDKAIEETATLEPPGSIAVVGGGPVGIEAALYGRYLGYAVRLFEAKAVANRLSVRREETIPMMPDRCLSPLARSALLAQSGETARGPSPLLIGEWIDQVWLPLTQTDLLRGRVVCPASVVAIDQVPVPIDDQESEDEDEEPAPPDFQLTLADGEKETFEAVILACGDGDPKVQLSFGVPVDYFFRISSADGGEAERDFWQGLAEIVRVYASLGGRADLDLYRPLRG